MANRMRAKNGEGPMSIWTTGVWQSNVTVMRWMEKLIVSIVKWCTRKY